MRIVIALCAGLLAASPCFADASPTIDGHLIEQPAGGEHIVEGRVYLERDGRPGFGGRDRALQGIAVSNGTRIVRTDAQGRYRIQVEAGATVFVIKPDGHRFVAGSDGLPHFWRTHGEHDGAQGWDFALETAPRVAQAGNGTEVLLFADTQVKSARDIDYYLRDVVEPLAASQTRSAFGVTLGDLVDDTLHLYPELNAVTTRIGVPWFHVPGNHDMDLDATGDDDALRSWRAVYGPDTYAVEEAGASFVFLDDVIHQPGVGNGYIGGLREDQFAFLETYLAQLPRERLLVIGVHIPLFDTGGRETFRAADRARLFALLRERPRLLVLSGHSHTQRQHWHGEADGWQGAAPLHEYNVGAVCGAFWSGVADAAGIPAATMSDGTPNGHASLQLRPDGGYALAWHPARVDGRDSASTAAMALHAPKVLRQGAYPAWGVYANVFMGDADTRVEYRVDDGAWTPMRRVERADPRLLVENVADDLATELRGYDRSPEATPSTHLWRGALPTTLASGEHRIDVRAFDRWQGEQLASTVYRLQAAE